MQIYLDMTTEVFDIHFVSFSSWLQRSFCFFPFQLKT